MDPGLRRDDDAFGLSKRHSVQTPLTYYPVPNIA